MAIAALALGVTTPAIGADEPIPNEPQEVTDNRIASVELTVTEETYLDGKLVTKRTLTSKDGDTLSAPAPDMADLTAKADAMAEADAASPDATAAAAAAPADAPCRKTTGVAHSKTQIGTTAYKYNVWTYWCWRPSDHYIYPGGKNGWNISNVSRLYDWKGEVRSEKYFYDWGPNNGRPRSAFYHYRQGKFSYCPLQFGCITSSYPSVALRSYGDGSWHYDWEV